VGDQADIYSLQDNRAAGFRVASLVNGFHDPGCGFTQDFVFAYFRPFQTTMNSVDFT
jgi:hypothetical protein